MSLSNLIKDEERRTIHLPDIVTEGSVKVNVGNISGCSIMYSRYNVRNKNASLTTSASHSGGRLKVMCKSIGLDNFVSVIYTGSSDPTNRRNLYITEPRFVDTQMASYDDIPTNKLNAILGYIREKLYPLICFQYEDGLSMTSSNSQLRDRLENDYCTDCVGLTLFDVLFPVSDGLVTLNHKTNVSGNPNNLIQFGSLLNDSKPNHVQMVLSYSDFSGISMVCPGGLYEIDHSDKYIYIIDTEHTDVITIDAVIIDKDDEENHYRLTHGYDFNPNPI